MIQLGQLGEMIQLGQLGDVLQVGQEFDDAIPRSKANRQPHHTGPAAGQSHSHPAQVSLPTNQLIVCLTSFISQLIRR
jgi:hypothetical protein